jgi:hypothetical protein
MSKKYKSSLNFVFRVCIETHCVGRIPGPQLAGNKPHFVAYIIVSVFCSSEGWLTLDLNMANEITCDYVWTSCTTPHFFNLL